MNIPRYAVGDCHVGDCRRPADHGGRHGPPTKAEQRALEAREEALTRSDIATQPNG